MSDGDGDYDAVWREDLVGTETGFTSAVAEILQAEESSVHISNALVDEIVFGVDDSLNWLFVTDGATLYLLTRAARRGIETTSGWAPATSCPLPDTWEQARAWLRVAARMIGS